MQSIWKFPLGVSAAIDIRMPVGARILCVQAQFGTPCIWALVDIDAPKLVARTFYTYCTGHQHEAMTGVYVGTYQLEGGALVFHVFEGLTP